MVQQRYARCASTTASAAVASTAAAAPDARCAEDSAIVQQDGGSPPTEVAVRDGHVAKFRASGGQPLVRYGRARQSRLARAAALSLWQPPSAWCSWGGPPRPEHVGCGAIVRRTEPDHALGDVPIGTIGEALSVPVEFGPITQSNEVEDDADADAAMDASRERATHAIEQDRRMTAEGDNHTDIRECVAVDLGCGAGGWTVGSTTAGLTVIGAIDGCETAVRTYRRNHGHDHPADVADLLDVETVVTTITTWMAKYPGRQLVLLASPPCQPYSTAGLGLRDDDVRVDVMAAVVAIAIAAGASALIVENVPRFARSPQLKAAERALQQAHYQTDCTVIDARDLGLPQRRLRCIFVASRLMLSGSISAASAAAAVGWRSVADVIPDVGFYYLHSRSSTGRCIYDASAEPSPTLRTNCSYYPSVVHGRPPKYRRRRGDAAPLCATQPLTASQLGQLQGFPEGYRWPELDIRCGCRFCGRSVRSVGKQIGNAIAPPMAAWAVDAVAGMRQAAIDERRMVAPAGTDTGADDSTTTAPPSQQLADADADADDDSRESRCAHRRRRAGDEIYSSVFIACRDLARHPMVAASSTAACRDCHRRCDCRSCTADVCPYDLSDSWHPANFEDQRSTHVGAVRAAMRKAQFYQLQRSDVRRDNSIRDPRQAFDDVPATGRPRAGDPRAMFAAYDTSTVVIDDTLPTQRVASARAHRQWLLMHTASCKACQVAAAAQRVTGSPRRPADDCYARWMLHQLRTGFDPVFVETPKRVRIPNHAPVYDDFDVTSQYLEQVERRGVLSPRQLTRPDFVAPLLTIVRPKHRREAERRGVTPKGRVCLDVKASTLNESLADWRFSYDTADAAVRLIHGPGAWVAKLDLEKYFLALAASERLQHHLWFSDPRFEPQWDARRDSDGDGAPRRRRRRWRRFITCIFGIKVLPAFANMVSGEICRYLRMMGVTLVTFLTDDFFIVASTYDECVRHMKVAISLFKLLGFRSPRAKNEGPARCLDFLGIDVDARGELRVNWSRLGQLAGRLRTIIDVGSVDFESFRSITGVMSWLAHYIRGARTFLRSFWDALKVASDSQSSDVAVSPALRADIAWWLYGIQNRCASGSPLVLHGRLLRTATIKSDGSGTGRWGFFATNDSHYGVIVWGGLPPHANIHVPYVEMFAVYIATLMFAPSYTGLLIKFGVDSAPVCDAINTGTSRDPYLLCLLRAMAAVQCIYRFDVCAPHCTRSCNGLADCATRHANIQEFHPHLRSEGFEPRACADTPQRCRWHSPLASSQIYALTLGRQRRTHWR